MHLHGENQKMSFNGRKLARNEQMDRRFLFMKIFWVHGVVCPCPRAIYMYMTKILKKNFFSETAWPIKAKLSLGRGNESLYEWSRSHDQDGGHGYK